MQTLHDARRGTSREAGRAWIAVALIPAFFVLAFAAGEGVISLLGYSDGGGAPTWASVIGDLTALVVALLPCVAAVVLGRRSRPEARWFTIAPAVIGAAVAAGLLVLTLVTEIGDLT